MSNEKLHSDTIDGIQYLRGLAASMVVLFHADAVMAFPEYYGSAFIGMHTPAGFAVQMFFCISGFIMATICLDPQGNPRLSISDFAKRRFVRIIPFMWVCIVGYNLLPFSEQALWGGRQCCARWFCGLSVISNRMCFGPFASS